MGSVSRLTPKQNKGPQGNRAQDGYRVIAPLGRTATFVTFFDVVRGAMRGSHYIQFYHGQEADQLRLCQRSPHRSAIDLHGAAVRRRASSAGSEIPKS